MRIHEKSQSHSKIAIALYKILSKRIPHNSSCVHLKDLVHLLMEALSRGEISISFDQDHSKNTSKTDGWPDEHINEIKSSGWLDGDKSPMVLKGIELSWRRWHEEMKSLLETLLEKSFSKPKYIKSISSKDPFQGTSKLNSKQLSAVNAISKTNLLLLSGGPGTGKTSTIVSILIYALSIEDSLKIGLAAPTGKATRRLEDTIQNSLKNVDNKYTEKLLDIPCLTIHSWLQANEEGFIKCKTNKLKLDILIIDEMSMVDISLMQGVINALPNQSQLILVGDLDQLPPVGIGAVWNELQRKNNQFNFKHCAVHLTKLYRNRGELASLSKVIRSKSLESFFKKLTHLPNKSNVKVISSSSKGEIPKTIIQSIRSHEKSLTKLRIKLKNLMQSNRNDLNSAEENQAAENLLNCLDQLIVLCPRRYGLWSVDHIHKTLLGEKLKEGVSQWPEGTPVICSQNQNELHLSNGDIGMIIERRKCKYLLFRVNSVDEKKRCQLIHPARVKIIEPAYAITIHKAQGSESNHVICMWPNQPKSKPIGYRDFRENEDYEKKLIYTAITRAKIELNLAIFLES